MRDELGRFIKNNKINLGKKHSKEAKRKMSKAHKGKKFSEECILKRVNSRKGYRHSDKTKRKIGKANYKGGRIKTSEGYILALKHGHPFYSKFGYVYEHRLIGESQIGRYLKPEEVVHHINKIRDDNRPEDLMAFVSHSVHLRFHGNPDNVKPEEIIFDGRKIKHCL